MTRKHEIAEEAWAALTKAMHAFKDGWMAAGLAVTGLVSLAVVSSETLLKAIVLNPILFYGLLIGELAAVWTFGITKALGTTPPAPPAGPPGAFPLTHLWFLYLLLIVYAVTLAARSLFAQLDAAGRLRCVIDQMVASGIRTGVAAFTFGIPLAVALFSIPMWFYWSGIPTPDHSLIPEIPAMRMEVDEHHRHKDVYTHSLTVLRQAIGLESRYDLRGDLVLRLQDSDRVAGGGLAAQLVGDLPGPERLPLPVRRL